MAVLLQLLCGMAIFSSACLYSVVSSDSQRLVMQLLSQLTMPAVIPVALLYFRAFRKPGPQNPAGMLVLLLPIALFIVELMLVAFLGHEESVALVRNIANGHWGVAYENNYAQLLYSCIVVVFPVIMVLEYVVLLITFIPVFVKTKKNSLVSFIKGKDSVRTTRLMAASLLVFVTLFLARYCVGVLTHIGWLGGLLDLLLAFAAFLVFFGGMFEVKESITMQDVRQAFRYNTTHDDESKYHRARFPLNTGVTFNPAAPHPASVSPAAASVTQTTQTEAQVLPAEAAGPSPATETSLTSPATSRDAAAGEPPTASTDQTRPEPPTAGNVPFSTLMQQLSIEEGSLQSRFEEVMINDQLFLMPGITLSLIAERLNTNKTYLSRMINSTYNLAFPEYLNALRIDYAEQYILHNRGVRQSEVAKACGFSSPSAFNNTFKKITGMTPKAWLTEHGDK